MSLVEEAFKGIFPEQEFDYDIKIKYSNRFSPYNASVRKREKQLEFRLSKHWKGVDKQIIIGLLQDLLLKIFNKKGSTINIELYNHFIKNLHLAVPKTRSEPVLQESFLRVNKKYFFSLIEQPNLEWGSDSRTKLASYSYQTDTITISLIFKNTREEIIDYLMHHELLHKKLKYYNKNGKNYHHTHKFRKHEKVFENQAEIEKELKQIARKRFFKFF